MPGEYLTEFLAAVREDSLGRAASLLRDFPEFANVRVRGSFWALDPKTSDSETETCAPIHYCAVHGRAQMAKLLLEAGADVNAHASEEDNDDGTVPIRLAAWEAARPACPSCT